MEFKKLLNRPIILGILGLVILAEIVWAVWALKTPPSNTVVPTAQQPTTTSVTLNAPKTTLKVGEEVIASINLSSAVKIDGVDLIIKFDPNLLSVKEAKAGAGPVVVGSIYSSYPQNLLVSPGRIVISGITNQTGGVLADGVFGSITFKTKKVGSTVVSFEFTPFSTTDSNVIESGTGKDVLQKVNNLELKILP